MPVIQNHALPFQVRSRVTQWLEAGVSKAAAEAYGDAAVDTGALRGSIRVDEPVVESDRISVSLLAGGGDVDYALDQEMTGTPFIRPAMYNLSEFLRF